MQTRPDNEVQTIKIRIKKFRAIWNEAIFSKENFIKFTSNDFSQPRYLGRPVMLVEAVQMKGWMFYETAVSQTPDTRSDVN